MLHVNLRATGPLTGRTLLHYQPCRYQSKAEKHVSRPKQCQHLISFYNLWQPVPISAYDVTCCCTHWQEWFFSCHWLKVSRDLLLLFSCWKWSVQNCQKTVVNAHFYRTIIVITFLIKTRPYINISVEMLNQMLYWKIFSHFFADSESIINVLLCQPCITSHGLGAFISFLTVIQCYCIQYHRANVSHQYNTVVQ